MAIGREAYRTSRMGAPFAWGSATESDVNGWSRTVHVAWPLLNSDGQAHWSRPAKPGHYLLRDDRNRAVVGQREILYPDACTGRYLPAASC